MDSTANGIDDAHLRQLIEVLPHAVFAKDRAGRFTYGNRALLSSLSLESLDELLGRTDADFFSAEEVAEYEQDDAKVLDGTTQWSKQEEQQRTRLGADTLRTTKIPICGADGQVRGLAGFSVDETEPTRMADELLRSEERYRLALQASRDGVWDCDLRSGTVELSPQALRMVQLPLDTPPIPMEDLRALIGRKDDERFVDGAARLLQNPGTPVTVTHPFEIEGETRIFESRMVALAEGGQVARIVGVLADVTSAVNHQAELRRQATHDDLTGLRNRRGFRAAIDELADDSKWFTVLYLDLDDFKLINDSLGHHIGDDLLMAVSERFRTLEHAPDELARLGGDEFALLYSSGDDGARATAAAAEIHALLTEPIRLGDYEVYTSASIGMARSDGRVQNAEASIIRSADMAMYTAKSAGKGRTRVFEAGMRLRAHQDLELHNRIRRAVDNQEFTLHYQPIWRGDGLGIRGVEALLRWEAPGETVYSPGVFLPYLEETGLIVDVGRWVFDEACRQLAAWHEEHPSLPELVMSVNLSRVQLADRDLVSAITSSLAAHEVSPNHIELEVTETAMATEAQVSDRLELLRHAGVSVAIDDFGVGQSSLSALQELPFDVLKIDRAFISKIDPRGRNPVLDAAFGIARSFGSKIVAEGVETSEQLDWLYDSGCDFLQGYLLGRPAAPADTIENILGETERIRRAA
jgi:diguanylate cyclase (GGDEF)-like protein